MKRKVLILVMVVMINAIWLLGGCESSGQTGALIGTLAGAGIGQLAGGSTESTLIGAAVGGGVIGAVRARLVASTCAEAAALDRAGAPGSAPRTGPGARYCPTASVPCCVRRVAWPATSSGIC